MYQDHLSSELASQRGDQFITKLFLEQLSQFIDTSSQQMNGNRHIQTIDSRFLKEVAKARVAIITLCKLLCEIYVSDTKIADSGDSERLKSIFPLLIKYTKPERNSELHLFVLRQIVFEHGYRELDQVIQRSEYDWLNLQHANGNNEAQVKLIFIFLLYILLSFIL